MTLSARVDLVVGTFHLDLGLRSAASEVVAVVGPNGSGKTTLLRVLAGLRPDGAVKVELNGRVLDDASTGIHLPPERRPVAMVFQELLLFPHLDLVRNVAFGMQARGVDRGTARVRSAEWLERLGLAGAAHRLPSGLSGGEAQRVALARALATGPELLLLDEPLSAIDPSARPALRRDLRQVLVEVPGVRLMVTHDPLDALAIADRLVVLESGRITQEGALEEVAARPRSAWVAQMVGLNLYRGEVRGGAVELPTGHVIHAVTGVEGPGFAVIHPRAVSLHRDRPEGSPRNAWLGEVGPMDLVVDRVRVEVSGPARVVAEVTPQAAAALHLADGGAVWVSVKATEVDVYPA